MPSSIINSNKSIYFIKRNTQWFAPIKILYEMLQNKSLLCGFSSIKILPKSKSSNLCHQNNNTCNFFKFFFFFYLPLFYILYFCSIFCEEKINTSSY